MSENAAPHERKRNRLQNWDYASEGLYFITVCTVQKQCSLGEIVGADAHIGPNNVPHICLSTIGKIVEHYLRTVPGMIRYCIMPNHIHALIRISSGMTECLPQPPSENSEGPMWASAPTKSLTVCSQNIPQRIRSFKTLVAKACGQTLFQRSYYDHIVRSEEDYLRICAYIDNNPAKWAEDVYFM